MKFRTVSFSLFLSLLLLQVSPVLAGSVNGFVIDQADREPLPVANIRVQGEKRGASTNLDGYFVIGNLPPGEVTLLVTYLGYEPARVRVNVDDKSSSPIYIELQRTSVELQEVIVHAKENDPDELRKSARVSILPVDQHTIRSIPSLGAEMDVLRALQLMPGVKATSEISSALHVRGGSPDMTLILMDHSVVYNPSHFFGLFSTFNAEAVKHLQLIKGGFPAEYGGRCGSVLQVITNEGDRNKLDGMASIGLISARGSLEGPLPNKAGSFAVSGRRTYMEPLLGFARKKFNMDLPDYYFYDTNGKINLDLSDRTTLTLAGYLGWDEFNSEYGPTDSRLHFDVDWGNRSFNTRLRTAMKQNLFLSLGTAVSEYRSRWSYRNEDIVLDEARNRFAEKSIKGDLELLGGSQHEIKSGFWFSRYDVELKEWNEDLTYFDVDSFTYNYAVYLQDKWRISDRFELLPGMRACYHDAGNHFRIDPRFAMVYFYSPSVRFKLAWGLYSQWVNLITLGENGSNFDIWIPVDGSMVPAVSQQIVAGVEWDTPFRANLSIEGYYTKLDHITEFNPMANGGEVAHDAFVVGHGYATGMDILLRKDQGQLSGWLGYSLSWTKRQFPGDLINHGDWYYPKYDRRHDFVSVLTWRLNESWELSTVWRYNTGQGFTQALGVYTHRYSNLPPDYLHEGGREVLPGSKNNYRFPADHRLDVAATYNHRFFHLPAKLRLSIYNVYNRRSYWQRTFDTTENPVQINDLKLLPILPLISYEVRF